MTDDFEKVCGLLVYNLRAAIKDLKPLDHIEVAIPTGLHWREAWAITTDVRGTTAEAHVDRHNRTVTLWLNRERMAAAGEILVKETT